MVVPKFFEVARASVPQFPPSLRRKLRKAFGKEGLRKIPKHAPKDPKPFCLPLEGCRPRPQKFLKTFCAQVWLQVLFQSPQNGPCNLEKNFGKDKGSKNSQARCKGWKTISPASPRALPNHPKVFKDFFPRFCCKGFCKFFPMVPKI